MALGVPVLPVLQELDVSVLPVPQGPLRKRHNQLPSPHALKKGLRQVQ